jgi:hypothetical protein
VSGDVVFFQGHLGILIGARERSEHQPHRRGGSGGPLKKLPQGTSRFLRAPRGRMVSRDARVSNSERGADVQADFRIYQRLLGGSDTVDHQLSVSGDCALDQAEGDRAQLVVSGGAADEADFPTFGK